jgi:hypothetical protein
MSRRSPGPSLSPQLLKHFAVATLAITAIIALFADGEGQNSLGQAVAVQEHLAEQTVVDAARHRAKPVMALNTRIRDARRSYVPLAGDDDGNDGAYGQPMDGSGGGGGGSAPRRYVPISAPQPIGPNGGAPDQAAIPGQGSAALDPRQAPRRGPQQQPTSRDLEQLQSASLRRSGDRGED